MLAQIRQVLIRPLVSRPHDDVEEGVSLLKRQRLEQNVVCTVEALRQLHDVVPVASTTSPWPDVMLAHARYSTRGTPAMYISLNSSAVSSSHARMVMWSAQTWHVVRCTSFPLFARRENRSTSGVAQSGQRTRLSPMATSREML